MKPHPPSFSDEVWNWLCQSDRVRPDLVAAGRARLATNDWPAPLDVADALLASLLSGSAA